MRVVVALRIVGACSLTACLAGAAAAQQQPPVPQPFPRPGQPSRPAQPPPQQPAPPPTTTTAPAPSPTRGSAAPETVPTEAMLGVPIYPGAQFLTSYDA